MRFFFRPAMCSTGAAALALLAGCTVGPDFTPPAAPATKSYTPEAAPSLSNPGPGAPQQQLTPGEKVSGEWWDLFHSDRLDTVLRDALAGNQTLAAAQATVAAAREQAGQAEGALWPQVDFGASASRQRSIEQSVGLNELSPLSNFYQIGPNVSYALDLFGLNKRKVEQQTALADYQDYQLDGAYLTLTGTAVKEAITIASARAQIAAIEAIIKDDDQTLDLVRREFNARNRTIVDVDTARTQAATDRATLPQLRQQLAIAKDALSVLAGKAPGDWTPPDFELAEFALPQNLPLTVPSVLVRDRPDILAAEAQLHAASAAVGVATAQLYPNITLSASLAQEALKTGTLFTAGGTAWDIMAGLTAPIFHGGALEAQKRGAEDTLKAAFATYRQTVLTSFGQVADTLQALDHDAQLVAAQQEAVASARSAHSASQQSVAAGNIEVLQLVDAERQYEQARLGAIRAAAQRYLDTVDLFAAMGGGWREWRMAAAGKPQS
ncbi:MAG TPA: efflux transporter outer membrane subunit [Stellaceae bacterium]|nr:efflux transporter outer membrane subunit [Stellaceae bacterium]